MPSATGQIPSADELLEFLPAFKVLICKKCQFAIQPTAVSRHLKERHHIYRDKRQKILDLVETLHLVEPADVVLPLPSHPPIPFLTIEFGLACNEVDCDHLCVTMKRMKRHWATRHERPGRDGYDWRPVTLQTFFRGACMRYFAVAAPISPLNHARTIGVESDSEPDERVHDIRMGVDYETQHISETIHYEPSNVPRPVKEFQFGMQDLQLLHHYTLFTSRTLRYRCEPDDFWSSTVPQIGFQFPYVMQGILALSALHLATTVPLERRCHLLRPAAEYQTNALPIYRSLVSQIDASNCASVFIFTVILSVHTRALVGLFQLHWNRSCDKDEDQLVQYLAFNRGGCSLWTQHMPLLENSIAACLLPKFDQMFFNSNEQDCRITGGCLARVVNNLVEEEAINLQHREEKRKTLLSAAGTLFNAFSNISISTSESKYQDAMEYWSNALSEEFLDLVRRRDLGAMVIVAHYCVIIKGTERNWSNIGHAAALLNIVKETLGPDQEHLIQWPIDQLNT